MKTLTFFVVLILTLCSCQTHDNSSEINNLKGEIFILNQRIDSLQVALLECGFQPKPTVKKAAKKPVQVVVKIPAPKKERTSYSSSYSSTSQQCAGTTKKGARCRRMVRGGAYCWQHGG